MMLAASLKKIKTMQDLRTEKLRLRYESLRAEDALNDSLHAFESVFSIFTVMRKASHSLQYAFNLASGVSSFFSRIFGKKHKKNQHTHEPSPGK
jgi:hypothetical protein